MQSLRPITRLAVVILLAVAAGGCGADDDPAGDVVAAAPDPATTADPKSGDGVGVVVDVAGVVRRPGVYRLPPGSRVHEAIDAAGGARRGAQLGSLNRAAILQDGQQVLVQSESTEVADGPGDGGAGGGSTVNVNAADAAALDALPGIGVVTAERIVADREANGPYASLDDLDRVPGIGPATVESLREVATA